MDVFPCKVWSADRRLKKTFMAPASIRAVVLEARKFGLPGSMLVLESDGSEICTDGVLEYYLKANCVLMLLESDEWGEKLAEPPIVSATSSKAIESISYVVEDRTTPVLYSTMVSPVTANDNHVVESVRPIIMKIEDSKVEIEPSTSYIKIENTKTEVQEVQSSSTSQFCIKHIDTVELDDDDDYDNDSTLDDATPMSMFNREMSPSSDSNMCETAKQAFENFRIPWKKVPTDVMDTLKKGERLGKRINVFANIIVDELRSLSFYIPMSVFRMVAKQAVAKYPQSLLDKDSDGKIISSTMVPLLSKLRNRYNHLNRKSSSPGQKVIIKLRKRSSLLQKSCTNWQPSEVPPEIKATSEDKQRFLKEIYGKEIDTKTKEQIKTYMEQCFARQREYFNNLANVPTVKNIKTDWPFIFEREYLGQHFFQLMNLEPSAFVNNFKNSQDKILDYLKDCKKKSVAEALSSRNMSGPYALVNGISKYFGDDISILIRFFKNDTRLDDIVPQIGRNTPVIAFVKRQSEEELSAGYIFIEKTCVAKFLNEEADFVEILNQTIHYYYAFNLMFPTPIWQTMEFLVRFFYKHYPGSTRGSMNMQTLTKLNNLIARISGLF